VSWVVPLKDITTRHVIVIVAFLGTLGALMALGKEAAVFIGVGLTVLAGLGIVAVQQASNAKETTLVREQTNGGQTRMMDMLAEQARQSQLTNDRLVAIIERQGELLAQMVNPAELPVIPIAALAAPEPPPDADPFQQPGETPGNYGTAPGPFPTQAAAA
jgi:hypothetical protein